MKVNIIKTQDYISLMILSATVRYSNLSEAKNADKMREKRLNVSSSFVNTNGKEYINWKTVEIYT